MEPTMSSSGFLEGLAIKGLWESAAAFLRKTAGREIKITSPRPQELLRSPEQRGSGFFVFPVSGTLKHLPKDHEIWLLVEDQRSGRVWPQGFFPVVFDPDQKTWNGKINPNIIGKTQPIKIVAVVAPPTSQDFFDYFQKLGDKTHHYEPLDGVPLECRKNSAFVQAQVPPEP